MTAYIVIGVVGLLCLAFILGGGERSMCPRCLRDYRDEDGHTCGGRA